MTNQEFKTLIHYFGTSFPDVHAKIKALENGTETLAAWQRVLGGLELSDAKAAVDSLLAGKEPQPFQWSAYPSLIRKLAERTAVKRRTQPASLEPLRPGKHSMVGMLDCVRECVKAGMDTPTALAEMNRRFPVDDSDYNPVRCLTCMDHGMVDVWDSRSTEAAMVPGATIKRHRSIVLCTCRASEKYQAQSEQLSGRQDANILPRYDDKIFCRWNRGDENHLLVWAESYSKNRIKSHPNYNSEFEEFN